MSSDAIASQSKPKDDSALRGKVADESEGEEGKKLGKEKPGEISRGQRVVSFRDFKKEKKEAEQDTSKKVSEGQVEV